MAASTDMFEILGPEHFEIVDHIELDRELVDGRPRWKLSCYAGGVAYYEPIYSLPGEVADLREFFELLRRLIVTQEQCHAEREHGR